jgi:predicted aspartyl protease
MKRISLVSFDRKAALIVVPVTIKVGAEIRKYDFAVDTGATISLINSSVMTELGYRQQDSIRTTQTITASKRETVYEYSLDNIMAIGFIRRNFRVISRSLPMGLGIDGLLGLNFFKNKELTIDFKLSEIRLN